MAERPTFKKAWDSFMEVNVPVKQVGKKIGGKVEININIPADKGGFQNACPIRMSYVLNKNGLVIKKSHNYKSVSGADGMQYIYHVDDMMEYLSQLFGEPDKTAKSPSPSDFRGMKGILVVRGHGWNDAKGHVTIWNGEICSDKCHLMHDPENGYFTPDVASIWSLE